MFSQSLPRRKSLLSVRAGTKTLATVSQDYLLGEACKARKRRIQTAHRQRQHSVAYCREPRLFSQSLPRRKSLLSVRAGTKTPAAVSQDCLLGGACKARKRRIQTAPRLWQSPTTLSFRGAKRRGNPLNRNVNTVAIATDIACFRNFYRAENLCYQFKQGQKLLPQFRKIVCLVCAPDGWIPTLTL